MSRVLVLAESGAVVRRSTRALLTVARQIGTPVVALPGPADPAIIALLGMYGAETVHPVEPLRTSARREPGARGAEARGAEARRSRAGESAANARQVRETDARDRSGRAGELPVAARSEMLVELAGRTDPAAILIASGRDGLEIAGRVGVRLNSGILTDVIGVPDWPVAVQSVRRGSCLVTSHVTRGVPILAVRTEYVTPVPVTPVPAPVPAPATPVVIPLRMAFPERVYAVRTRTPGPSELPTASVIVTGGRGVGSREAFALVHRLAEALGGVAGGSHAATEQGWCSREALVDQVGAIVHPSLYLALGVHGSQRHCAGMRGATTIVAIDSDPAAPIFRLCDLGVVGDVHQVVPELLAEIERRRS